MMLIPLIIVIALLYFIANKDSSCNCNNSDFSTCNKCGYILKDEYIYCPKCREKLKKECERCGKMIDITWRRCPFCE